MDAAVSARSVNWVAMMTSDLNLKVLSSFWIWRGVAFSMLTKLVASSSC